MSSPTSSTDNEVVLSDDARTQKIRELNDQLRQCILSRRINQTRRPSTWLDRRRRNDSVSPRLRVRAVGWASEEW